MGGGDHLGPEVPPLDAWPDHIPHGKPNGALHAAEPDSDIQEPSIRATPFLWKAEAGIPPRKWLYGKHLLRRFVSLDVAAGGVGKSSLKIGEALAMASGRDIYAQGLPEGPLGVWMYNLEDPYEEVERRIHATAKRFQIEPGDFGGRLFVNSGRDNPLVIAEDTPNGTRIIRPNTDMFVEAMLSNGIDVGIVDPFVSSHNVNENDNGAIDMVAKEWNRIAEVCNCSINLVHHVRKQNGEAATADSARGASALIGAARSAMVYNRMTAAEAESLEVKPDERGFYFRVDNDKANLAPPTVATWYRMNSVELDNGDSVGVACPWAPPDAFRNISTQSLMAVQRAVAGGDWRADVRAKAWAGRAIANALSLDADSETDKGRIKKLLKTWLETNVLAIEDRRDGDSRKSFDYVVVGEWVRE